MIKINYSEDEILFEWDNPENSYSDDILLNGLITTPKKISNKKKLNGDFFVIYMENFYFTITNEYVLGVHNYLGSFKGKLNEKINFVLNDYKEPLICGCHNN